jgi:hypothetical protein
VRALRNENEAYQRVTVMRVDWNQYSRSELVRELRVPRRSTLIMFKGGEELGRVVAQTSESAIGALFEKAVGS